MEFRITRNGYIHNILYMLHDRLMSGNLEGIKKIHKQCKEDNISFYELDNYMVSHFLNGFTILHYALSGYNLELIQYLLTKTSIDINKLDRYNTSIFHKIGFSYKGDISIIKYLLQHDNTNINVYNHFGDLPIEIASFYGMKEYIQLLICYGSICNIKKCIKQASFCHHNDLIIWFQERMNWKKIQFQCEYGFSVWSPENHIYWSLEYKKMVFTLLCIIYKKYTHFEKGILYNIFEYISWF